MSSQFTHLHFHTQYSLLDGAIRVKPLPNQLQELGYKSCAITDHGNMHGVLHFHDTMKSAGIKPIIGMEGYVSEGSRFKRDYPKGNTHTYHTVFLCQNKIGYQNLIKLSSYAYTEGKFYGKPRVDHELLEQHNEGIIVLSACMSGEIAKRLLQGRKDEAKKIAQWYSQVFEGRYYIELQANGLDDQNRVNPMLIELARELDIPLVGTNDCHYTTRDQAEAHYILQLMGQQKRITDENTWKHETSELYIKSPEEMAEAFSDLPEECLLNAAKIADECDFEMKKSDPILPDFPVDAGLTLEEQLKKDARDGLENHLVNLARLYRWSEEEEKKQREIYKKRLEFELDIIIKMGFPGYFLIVADFVKWSKNNGVPVGPGRGSGAGSLVAYSLLITDVDPLKYDLLFERFLNPERISMPDFDIDFEPVGREKVIDYVRKKYGEKNVCQISALGSLKAKGAVRGVARVLDIPYGDADKIAKLIPDDLKMTVEKAIEMEPELKRLSEEGSETEQKLIKLSRDLEGLNSNLSTHAAGVIIMDSEISDVMPTCTPSKSESVQSQFTMEHAEHQGAVKFDFLGLRNLSIIDLAEGLINADKTEEEKLDISLIPLDDQATFDLLSRGDTTGVFQMESGGMKALLQKLKPDCFEDVIALVALYRPGPLGSGMVDDYVDVKHARKEAEYPHPLMETVLKETNGVMVYQEQVMRTVQVLAGFSLGQADLLRRAIGKKKEEILLEQRSIFVKGCAEANQIEEKLSNYIFDLIDKFAGYGFNKSHSAAYGLIGYQTAWLKAHYPVEFMAALLTVDKNRPESVVKLIHECREMGISVLPPDINKSELDFTTDNGRIRFGLNAIKNVGETALLSILDAREECGEFESLLEVFSNINTSKVNSRVLEALVKSGVFDSLEPNRKRLFENLDQAIELGSDEQSFQIENQVNMFAMLDESETDKSKPKLELPDIPDWNKKLRLQFEKEALGFYISGHPLDPFADDINQISGIIEILSIKDESREFKYGEKNSIAVIISANTVKMTKKNEKFSILQVEDLTGSLEVMVYSRVWQQVNRLLDRDDPVLITGTIRTNYEGQRNMVADTVQSLNMIRAEKATRMIMNIAGEGTGEKLPDIRSLLRSCPGQCSVMASVVADNGCKVLLTLEEKININESLISGMEYLLGDQNYVFRYT